MKQWSEFSAKAKNSQATGNFKCWRKTCLRRGLGKPYGILGTMGPQKLKINSYISWFRGLRGRLPLRLACSDLADILLLNQHFPDSWDQPACVCHHWRWCHQPDLHCCLCKSLPRGALCPLLGPGVQVGWCPMIKSIRSFVHVPCVCTDKWVVGKVLCTHRLLL